MPKPRAVRAPHRSNNVALEGVQRPCHGRRDPGYRRARAYAKLRMLLAFCPWHARIRWGCASGEGAIPARPQGSCQQAEPRDRAAVSSASAYVVTVQDTRERERAKPQWQAPMVDGRRHLTTGLGRVMRRNRPCKASRNDWLRRAIQCKTVRALSCRSTGELLCFSCGRRVTSTSEHARGPRGGGILVTPDETNSDAMAPNSGAMMSTQQSDAGLQS